MSRKSPGVVGIQKSSSLGIQIDQSIVDLNSFREAIELHSAALAVNGSSSFADTYRAVCELEQRVPISRENQKTSLHHEAASAQ